jgi:hypothetical protein
LNLDEIPLPFEFLDGHTYDVVGTKSVDAKTARSGWGKRQATLILYIFADGEARLCPTLIFHGQGNVTAAERAAYHPGVVVKFNKEAYNNEDLFLSWIDQQLQPILEGDTMLIMDVASFHKTDAVRARLQKELPAYVLPAMIPGGLTCLLQPLDTAVNSMFKKLLQDAIDEYITTWEREHLGQAWAVKDKRIMMTHVVADVWRRVCDEKKEIVVKSFIDTGIAIRPDGSQDHLINIKGISNVAWWHHVIHHVTHCAGFHPATFCPGFPPSNNNNFNRFISLTTPLLFPRHQILHSFGMAGRKQWISQSRRRTMRRSLQSLTTWLPSSQPPRM